MVQSEDFMVQSEMMKRLEQWKTDDNISAHSLGNIKMLEIALRKGLLNANRVTEAELKSWIIGVPDDSLMEKIKKEQRDEVKRYLDVLQEDSNGISTIMEAIEAGKVELDCVLEDAARGLIDTSIFEGFEDYVANTIRSQNRKETDKFLKEHRGDPSLSEEAKRNLADIEYAYENNLLDIDNFYDDGAYDINALYEWMEFGCFSSRLQELIDSHRKEHDGDIVMHFMKSAAEESILPENGSKKSGLISMGRKNLEKGEGEKESDRS